MSNQTPDVERSERAVLPGNASFVHTNAAILSVTAVDAPIVVTSESFDEQLAETYERTGFRPGMLSVVAGIEERRWWTEDVSFADAAAMAGSKAIAEAGIDPRKIALLIDSSVCRDHLEPSKAVAVHHQLGLAPACMNFDLSNACLGFVNAMQLGATMIDAGHVEYAIVVDGEGSRRTQELTVERLARPETTAEDVWSQFASLTLGSGGAAMVLGRADEHPEGHRILGGTTRAATQHHELCVGTLEDMRTDSKALFAAGIQISIELWEEAKATFDWGSMDRYVSHQISKVHTAAITEALNIDPDKAPSTFPTRGNIGPASVPFTLALEADSLSPGDRVLLMGIGSGINASALEIEW
ncbi:MAG TPA: 3-oxoacyl-ACP synthase III [Candidatus Limnocylindria bacterium]|nr:3-oxoacyl-ACP synthase III [Candidatus Limnocylindria bacterium]